MSNRVNDVLADIRESLVGAQRLLLSPQDFSGALVLLRRCRTLLDRVHGHISDEQFNSCSASVDALISICSSTTEPSTDSFHPDLVPTGGRPRIDIAQRQLQVLFNAGFSGTCAADILQCSRRTVHRALERYGMSFRGRFSAIGDVELEQRIQNISAQHPNCGRWMMSGCLRGTGVVVSQARVGRILAKVDPVGCAHRWSQVLSRRVYRVAGANALWHIDAHMKLIRWKIVTHGIIDGHSRLITSLRCNTLNSSQDVLEFFLDAIRKFGVPSRVRSDFGYENFLIGLFMNVVRGVNRGSLITGQSVHNQRIERLWRDVYKEVIDVFYRELYSLEDEGVLESANQNHIYAAQRAYVPSVDARLQEFQKAWNEHQLRTEHYMSPNQLWLRDILRRYNCTAVEIEDLFLHSATDLQQRIVDSLTSQAINIPVISPQPVQSLDPVAAVTVSDAVESEIIRILNNENNCRLRYLSIVALLENS